ncbi:hypothetical protein P7C71_g2971, partial [Lecanoromycetidae sp. Uapishka_2]
MSFTRAFTRKALPLTRTRLFTTTPYVQKTATEQAKETVHKVNKAVSEPLVKGIEKGQEATQNLKSSTGLGAQKAEGSAAEMTGEAKGKAQGMAGEAKGKAQEMAGEAKGKASEVSGQAKGKTEEIKSKM